MIYLYIHIRPKMGMWPATGRSWPVHPQYGRISRPFQPLPGLRLHQLAQQILTWAASSGFGGWARPAALWKIWELVNWDDDIPNWMGKYRMFQTNQIKSMHLGECSILESGHCTGMYLGYQEDSFPTQTMRRSPKRESLLWKSRANEDENTNDTSAEWIKIRYSDVKPYKPMQTQTNQTH